MKLKLIVKKIRVAIFVLNDDDPFDLAVFTEHEQLLNKSFDSSEDLALEEIDFPKGKTFHLRIRDSWELEVNYRLTYDDIMKYSENGVLPIRLNVDLY